MEFFDFCAGIGAGRLGLEKAGMTCVGYSEINKAAIRSYNLLHNTYGEKNYGNLTKIKAEELPDFDLAIAGFPCQTFSVIGKQEGFEDPRGQIIFQILDLLIAKKIKYFIFENVKGLVTHDEGKTIQIMLSAMADAGYAVQYRVLSSMSYGVPQMRQRIYFIGIRKDLVKQGKNFKWSYDCHNKSIQELLISNTNIVANKEIELVKAYLQDKTNQGKIMFEEILQKEYVVVDTRQSDLRLYYNRIPTLRSFRDGLYYVRDGKLRSLTGYEAMLIQGFPTDYADRVIDVPVRDLLRQTGNSMTVGVVEALGKSLINYLSTESEKLSVQKKDTVVGLVKSKEQFDYCLKKKIYYTYKSSLPSDIDDVKYVAIYQTKSAFGYDEAGIFLAGEVKKTFNVKRSQIHFNEASKKQDKECVVYQISEWKKLDKPILPSGNAKAIVVINKNKLHKSNIYSDLVEE